MPLPVEFNTIKVHGKYLDWNGAPVAGTIVFTPSSRVTAPGASTIILPKPVEVVLDPNGEFNVNLPASDDPDVSVTFSYTVEEKLTGVSGSKYVINVPVATVGTLELSNLSPLPNPTPAQSNYLVHGIVLNAGDPTPAVPNDTLIFRKA